MGKRIGVSTKDYLTNAALPNYTTGRYAVISHQEVMDFTDQALKANNLEIEHELYKCNLNANVAQGVYHINAGSDPEMKMMFAWVNSYDKSTRFKCCVGGVLTINGNYCIAGDMGNWVRKHTGNAKQEAFDEIDNQILNATTYYMRLIGDKAVMKTVIVPEKLRAEILGRMLFQDKTLTMEQAGVIRAQIENPGFDYNADKDSLWALYNHINHSLKKSHPSKWLDTQRKIHIDLCLEFGITQPAVASPNNQTNLIRAIAEVEVSKEDEISFEL